MKTYDIFFRNKVLQVVDEGEYTIREVSELFGVGETFIYKLLRQRKETGDVSPRAKGGLRKPLLDEQGLRKLEELVAKFPDATLLEFSQKIKEELSIAITIWSVARSLKKLKITLKKRQNLPPRRTKKSS